MLFQRQ